jgi:hypothetical protein
MFHPVLFLHPIKLFSMFCPSFSDWLHRAEGSRPCGGLQQAGIGACKCVCVLGGVSTWECLEEPVVLVDAIMDMVVGVGRRVGVRGLWRWVDVWMCRCVCA